MRILFNHGLTAGELYTNTPKKIIDKKWRWMISHYGWTETYEDAIADPFKYSFSLIINKILNERVRFKIPVTTEAYIDFEIVTGDKFEQHRQNGRFSEIDFIESDFTGYFLNYFYKTKAYKKSMPIYLGGNLKKKFLDGINSGIKYYTIRDFTINDIIDEIHEKYSDFTKAELKKIIVHGFTRMHSSIKFGCAISISSKRYDCLAYIGSLSLIPEKQIREYSIRRDRKLRKIDGWKKPVFDGYYYIGLNPTGFERWVEDNKTSRSIVRFSKVIPRRLQEELYYKAKKVYVFRFKRDTFKGYAYWADELNIRNLEYLGESNEHKFTPSDKTWKELRKEYEKRSDQYLSRGA